MRTRCGVVKKTMSKDERLAESVSSYPVRYDKSHAGHKDNLQKDNAWKLVAEECCIGDVNTVKETEKVVESFL